MKLPTNTSDMLDALPYAAQERLATLLDEYLASLESGVPVDPEELAAAHPDLREPLFKYLGSLGFLHGAASELPVARHGEPPAAHRSDEAESIEPLAALEDHPRHAPSTSSRTRRKRLGDYVLEREIGRGGMGVVYEARQLSLDRRVAVKVLPFAAVLDQKQIARFQNEAQAAAQLDHPHIVPVYSVGCERGVHYYSMRYIEGRSIEQAIDELRRFAATQPGRGSSAWSARRAEYSAETQRFAPGVDPAVDQLQRDEARQAARARYAESDQPPASSQAPRSTLATSGGFVTNCSIFSRSHARRVAVLGIQAAEALAYAHDLGIVHRDVKPSNLLIDQQGQVWVTDFGLARCRAGKELTRTGEVLGTLRYMSPEQATGQAHLIDHRTDIYALGVTLYELLTLRAAHDTEARQELRARIEHGVPPAPRRLNPAVPVDLETILLKAIATSRDDRYPTAGAFADDLRRFLDGRPTIARRPTLLDRAARWIVRHARAMAVAACFAALLLVLVAAGLLGWHYHHEAEQRLQTLRELERQLAASRYRTGARDAPGLPSTPGSELTTRARLEADRRRYERLAVEFTRNATGQDQLGLLYATIADLSVQLGDTEGALHAYEQAKSAFRAQQRGDPDDLIPAAASAVCDVNQAELLGDIGRAEAADEAFERAMAQQRELVDRHPDEPSLRREWALTSMNRGMLRFRLGDLLQARALCEQAIEQLRKLPERSSHGGLDEDVRTEAALACARGNLAVVLAVDEPARAEQLYREAIAVHEHLAERFPERPEHHHEAATCWNNLGSLQARQRDYEHAVDAFSRALEQQERCVRLTPFATQRRQELARTWNNLAQTQLGIRKISEARVSLNTARIILRELTAASPADPNTLSLLAAMHHNMAVIAEHDGDLAGSFAGFNEACRQQQSAIELAPGVTEYVTLLAAHQGQRDRLLAAWSRSPTSTPERMEQGAP